MKISKSRTHFSVRNTFVEVILHIYPDLYFSDLLVLEYTTILQPKALLAPENEAWRFYKPKA